MATLDNKKQKPIPNGHRFSIQLVFCATFFSCLHFNACTLVFVYANDFRIVQRANQTYSIRFKVSFFFVFVFFSLHTELKIGFRLVEPSKLAAMKVNQGSHHTSVVVYMLTSVSWRIHKTHLAQNNSWQTCGWNK